MTEQHPLTDELAESIALTRQWAGDIGDVVFRHDDMRAVADWQLEQAIECLLDCPYKFMSIEWLCNYLRKELRPQEES